MVEVLRIITIYGSDSKIIICDQHLTGQEHGSTILPADVVCFSIPTTRVENFSKIRSSPADASSHEQRLQHDRSTHDDRQRTFRE